MGVMSETKQADPITSRWDDAVAATLSEPELLLYRSNLLGSDLRITNFGGGNTSAKIDMVDPLSGETGRSAVGEGLGRRPGFDQARRLLDPVHGQAARPEEPLPRPRARRRDGRLPAALHLQPEPARRQHRHPAARLHRAQARRPHAPGFLHRDRRLQEQQGTDREDLRRRTRLAAMAASRLRPGPEAGSRCRRRTRT
jgi:hypothetical protein